MQYAIFPMQYINITQRHYTDKGNSHYEIKAIDSAGKDSDSYPGEWVYAPTRIRVIGEQGTSNTVFFGTCNSQGEEATVRCEDGVDRVLTFAFTHMDDSDRTDLLLDDNGNLDTTRIFQSGDICYREGSKGCQAKHVHIEVAQGWVTAKELFYDGYGNGTVLYRFADSVSLFPHQIFFKLSGWNVEVFLNGYTYTAMNTRDDNIPTPTPPTLYLKANQLTFRIRSSVVSGSSLLTVPVGNRALINGFLGKQSDGYQWAATKYNGTVGYSQIDTHNAYLVQGATVDNYPVYLEASQLTFRIRSSVVSGSTLVVVPVGSKAVIKNFLGKQSDGYQWAEVEFLNITGYSQIDTHNAYLLTF